MYFCVPFLVIQYVEYCMLEDCSTKNEICDMYICVRCVNGQNLKRRDLIGTKLSMIPSQPMKNLIPEIQPIREFLCVMCAVGATMASNPRIPLGNH